MVPPSPQPFVHLMDGGRRVAVTAMNRIPVAGGDELGFDARFFRRSAAMETLHQSSTTWSHRRPQICLHHLCSGSSRRSGTDPVLIIPGDGVQAETDKLPSQATG
ncbi:hypothetical protein DPEC_G00076190 [Dallia pectoralis]|uniref:Uncharacterized protein n=1 Tax=Dallia pectoralis TaxID=75939 RepID=A0ACC2H3E6_DALPE|nr:hypothetical protein DPEC_G00076190 [Dallia pectoralis]